MLSPEELSAVDESDFSIECQRVPPLCANCLSWALPRLQLPPVQA
jgi:hypothetical protein